MSEKVPRGHSAPASSRSLYKPLIAKRYISILSRIFFFEFRLKYVLVFKRFCHNKSEGVRSFEFNCKMYFVWDNFASCRLWRFRKEALKDDLKWELWLKFASHIWYIIYPWRVIRASIRNFATEMCSCQSGAAWIKNCSRSS